MTKFFNAIKTTARAIHAPLNETIVQRVLSDYPGFADPRSALALRTTTKRDPSLSFRYVNLYLTERPPGPRCAVLSQLESKFHGRLRYGVDASADFGMEKIWAIFMNGPRPLGELFELTELPDSTRRAADMLARYNLTRFALAAIDYKNTSINLYFMNPPNDVAGLVDKLKFKEPDQSTLDLVSRTMCVGVTFDFEHEVPTRMCCYFPMRLDELPVEVHPRLKSFADNAEFAVEDKRVIHGVSFGPDLIYHKPEFEYNGTMMTVFANLVGAVSV